MCGIAGILFPEPVCPADQLQGIAQHMGDALVSRGPDDHGVWVDSAHGIALAHRRLSIIDLSPEGHQPKSSSSGRYIVSYNGEIYNYRELRAKLEYPWCGESDTEVLLAAIEVWGVEKALTEINGMFAFALWDKQAQTLTLARDRMGEKPVYYGWVGDQFVFASELKAFHAIPGWPPAINREALNLYMRYSYIPAPHSIYQGIYKLPPAHILMLRAGQKQAMPRAYWSFEAMVLHRRSKGFSGTVNEATDQLEAILKHAVGQRMMADVPLGAFLSGGVDSSTIAALMQAQSPRPIKTFTIGFHELGFDEAPYAKAVAGHLHTDHQEIYLTAEDAASVIPQLPYIYDEPFADSSQIPTYLVSKFARTQVTVALSGDGGDELFSGYNRYRRGATLWMVISALPPGLRHRVAALLMTAHRALLHRVGTGGSSRMRFLIRKLGNYYEKIGTHSAEEFYRRLCSVHDHPEEVVLHGIDPTTPRRNNLSLNFTEWMMMEDALGYFPGDILTKVDRAAMAVSLETRTPFTDPELMGFAWQLPLSMKLRGGTGKYLLRQVLYRHVPRNLIERPKAGFSVPIGAWLRGPLKPWAEELLAPIMATGQQDYFNTEAVKVMWHQHQSGQHDREHALWNILMFQSWLQHQR